MEIKPSFDRFKKLSQRHNLIVLSHKFYADWLTPLSVYHKLARMIKGESFLLESVEGEEKICRFSFLGFDPICTFKSKNDTVYIKNKTSRSFKTKKDPLSELKKMMRSFKAAPKEHIRFFGGFVGYAGYDIVKFYEPVGKVKKNSLGTPDTYFILPKFLIIFDHVQKQIELLSFIVTNSKKNLKQLYLKEKKTLEGLYKKICDAYKLAPLSFKRKNIKLKSNFKKKDFLEAVRKTKKYIKEGDIIQAVLSQRFFADFKGDPFEVYRHLRILNPSPYMFFLNFKDAIVCGSSPEMLLRCEDGQIITRPIAGTRPRGKNDAEDARLAKSLLNDAKERAEHIMLVDLARNDLGRVAKRGSVEVPIFMTVEKFSHVMHIVSEAQAKLAKDKDLFATLVSCFPAGTVSGAPKVRAMQIINELEPEARGIYAGAVGYFSFTNSLDTCIIIRTIIFKNKKAYFQAGAGIVNDSVPEREYKETVNKAKAASEAIRLAS